jgi:hypothetical protein
VLAFVAADMLKEGRIDAFATNKGAPKQLADGLPDACSTADGAESLGLRCQRERLAARWGITARVTGAVASAGLRDGRGEVR